MKSDQPSAISHQPTSVRAMALGVGCWISDVGCFLLISLIRLYRCTLSPAQIFLFGPHAGCRYTPSCSRYAIEALRTHGALRGSWLATKRICRCHPWGECGCDPVPEKAESGKRKVETQLAVAHS
jgi:putative membrane protein insertion efficiency factor